MGYTTEFTGHVTVTPPLNEDEVSFLNDLASTRRMKRTRGPLFVKGTGDFGQAADPDILDSNSAQGEPSFMPDKKHLPYTPDDQPGLWLQWVPSGDGMSISWDGGEKFYNAKEWMRYLIDKLLSPKAGDYIIEHCSEDPRLSSFTYDHTVNGEILAEGEEQGDVWKLVVTDNVVTVQQASLSWE